MIKLLSQYPSNDPFGAGRPSSAGDDTTPIKLYTENFLPRTPIPEAVPSLFEALGSGTMPGHYTFEKINLVPEPKGTSLFDGPASGGTVKLLPMEKNNSIFDSPAGAEPARSELPLGEFRKSARKFRVGDKVRSRDLKFHANDIFTVIEECPNGTLRCESRHGSVGWITFPDRLVFAG